MLCGLLYNHKYFALLTFLLQSHVKRWAQIRNRVFFHSSMRESDIINVLPKMPQRAQFGVLHKFLKQTARSLKADGEIVPMDVPEPVRIYYYCLFTLVAHSNFKNFVKSTLYLNLTLISRNFCEIPTYLLSINIILILISPIFETTNFFLEEKVF